LELNYSLKAVQKIAQLAYSCLSRDPKCRPNMDEVVNTLTPLQDLNDFAILSYHSRLSQQGRRKKKPDGTPHITYTHSKSMRASPLNTGKHLRWCLKRNPLLWNASFVCCCVWRWTFQACKSFLVFKIC
jgi:hypothetical protein